MRSLLLALFGLTGCAAIPQVERPMPNSTIVLNGASAEARTRAALERIEALNPRLNAVIAVDPTAIEQARALDRATDARGPLFGMPILIKDNIETAGPLPTTAGSLALADNVTDRDAPLVARLRAAGAVIVGKANLSEWANIRSSQFDLRLERGRRPDAQPSCAQPQPVRIQLRAAPSRSPPAWCRRRSAPRPTDRSPARRRSTASSASSPPSAWSAAPMSCRSATARTRPGR